jgi:hypothetical protein
MGAYEDFYNSTVFPTTPAAPISYNIPQALSGPANGELTLAQQMQKDGINPSLMGGLLSTAYSTPALSGPTTGTWSTPSQNTAYIADAKNNFGETAAQRAAREAQWASMQLGSNVYNPNGANTMNIQNGGGNNPLPLFTNTTQTPVTPVNNGGTGGALALRSGTASGLSSSGNPQYAPQGFGNFGGGQGLQQASSLPQTQTGGDSWNGNNNWNNAIWSKR